MLPACSERLVAAVVSVPETVQGLLLGERIAYLRDQTGSLTLDEVRAVSDGWQQSTQREPNFGYTDAVYWFRLDLQAGARPTDDYLLEIDYAVLDDIQAHVLRDGRVLDQVRLGGRLPYQQRPIDHPNYLVPLSLSADEPTRVYLRVDTDSAMQLPVYLWDTQSFLERDYERTVMRAIFYGAMVVMVLYNLLVFSATRDISYLYYVLHVACMAFFMFAMHGVSYKFLWPGAPYWNSASLLVALSGAVLFPCLFTRRFLALPQHRPWLSNALMAVVVLSALVGLAAFFVSYANLVIFAILAAVLSIITNFSAGIIRWMDGSRPAFYYNLAWTLLLLGAFVFALNKLGVLPRNWLTENGVLLGVGAEMVLLSFALVSRMNEERRLREEAQQETAQTQRELLDAQVEQTRKLDRLVQERTLELEEANRKLTEMSMTDGLTGVRNRRYLDHILEREFQRARRQQSRLALLMIDIDHFKQINDSNGHAIGDACLIAVAGRIEGQVRRSQDVVARYGGEEFVVLLPDLDEEGAWEVARAIHRVINGEPINVEETPFSLTASTGVALMTPEPEETDPELLVRQADQYLYWAKSAGRNRIVGARAEEVV